MALKHVNNSFTFFDWLILGTHLELCYVPKALLWYILCLYFMYWSLVLTWKKLKIKGTLTQQTMFVGDVPWCPWSIPHDAPLVGHLSVLSCVYDLALVYQDASQQQRTLVPFWDVRYSFFHFSPRPFPVR